MRINVSLLSLFVTRHAAVVSSFGTTTTTTTNLATARSSGIAFAPPTKTTTTPTINDLHGAAPSSVRLRSSSVLVDEPTLNDIDAEDVSTTAQLLAHLWDMIVSGEEMGRGEEKTALFPKMLEKFADHVFMTRLMHHFDVCKDVCDDFGITIHLIPKRDEESGQTLGFTVKSYGDPISSNELDANDDTGGYKFKNDPMWNDDVEITDYGALFDDDDDDYGDETTARLLPLPDDDGVTDETMISVTKNWVDTMMSNMGVCPFTSGPDMAGLPLGKVFYTVDRISRTEHVYRSYWRELVRMESANERELSTTLLILPNYSLNNVELFENIGNTLTQPLEPLGLEDLTQLVFFHPRWTFRDGSNRSGESAAANYARRSSWPMINLLRTTQVRAAQRGIPTGLVYQQNEKTLNAVGTTELEEMLCERNWDRLADVKVNRKEHDALALARTMQEVSTENDGDADAVEEVVRESVLKDLDKNAAVNQVDRSKIDGGDLVNVLRQALDKRLDDEDRLSGTETSATMYASDFLLEELDRIAAQAAVE